MRGLILAMLVVLWGCAADPPLTANAGSTDSPPPKSSSSATPASLVVETKTLEVREEVEWMHLSADLWPKRRAVLAAEVSGRVESLTVDEGARVRAGQMLASIDRAALEQQVAEAEALHRQSLITFDRSEKLLEKRAITQPQFLEALTRRDVAAAQMASARLQLEKSTVEAPWAGVLSRREVEVGDFVQTGQPLFELLELKILEARAHAPAQEIPFLAEGAPARVRIAALGGKVFDGTLSRLAAALDPATRTLEIEIRLENPQLELRPGMAARVELPRRTLPEALLIPLAAVVEYEDAQAVYLLDEGKAARRFVTLGPVIGEEVVVEAGLRAGDRLIVKGQDRVSEGQRVEEAVREDGA